jgi:hypothetical protein
VQPGFQFNHALTESPSNYYAPSIMHIKFVNGYERKYNINLSLLSTIITEINWINHMVEYERSHGG